MIIFIHISGIIVVLSKYIIRFLCKCFFLLPYEIQSSEYYCFDFKKEAMILMLETINPVGLKTIKIWICDGYIANTPI